MLRSFGQEDGTAVDAIDSHGDDASHGGHTSSKPVRLRDVREQRRLPMGVVNAAFT